MVASGIRIRARRRSATTRGLRRPDGLGGRAHRARCKALPATTQLRSGAITRRGCEEVVLGNSRSIRSNGASRRIRSRRRPIGGKRRDSLAGRMAAACSASWCRVRSFCCAARPRWRRLSRAIVSRTKRRAATRKAGTGHQLETLACISSPRSCAGERDADPGFAGMLQEQIALQGHPGALREALGASRSRRLRRRLAPDLCCLTGSIN